MSATYDVIVVGSGPAGSCAAWRLAQAGVAVAVIEKAALPRYKTCGGGIVERAMQALPFNVRHVTERECHTAQLSFLPAGLSFTTHRPTPIISMTMRDQLTMPFFPQLKQPEQPSTNNVPSRTCRSTSISSQSLQTRAR